MRTVIVTCIVVVTTCILAAAQAPALSDRDWKRWLDDVAPLLTATEKAEARKTAAQQRDAFREAFWARRNPTPGQADNARRAEFDLRVRTADKRFRDGSSWNDCGKVFVLLGKPDRVTNRTGAAHFAGGDRLAAMREQDDVEAEAWWYRNPAGLPAAPEGYAFRFTQTCQSLGGPAFDRLLQSVAASVVVAR